MYQCQNRGPYLGRKMTRFDQSHDDTVDDPGDELWAEVPLHDGGEQQLVAADGAPVSAHSARQHRVAVVEVGEDLHQHLARQRPPAQLSHPPQSRPGLFIISSMVF